MSDRALILSKLGEREMTQAALAKMAGFSEAYVSRAIRNQGGFTASERFRKLAWKIANIPQYAWDL